MYGKYAGTELHYEGEDYLVMKQADIIAVID
ncbi:MAG: co-chaperone GroES, partial [Alistipes sp.]|nr:co-chaperone GroES [Alistipes sp.]